MAGKGDRMRRVNGPKYRDNYDAIKWDKPEEGQEDTHETCTPSIINDEHPRVAE